MSFWAVRGSSPPKKKPEAPKPADPLSEPIKSSPVADSQPSTDSQPASQPASTPESKPDLQGPAIPGVSKDADKDKDPPFVAKAPAAAQLIVIGDSDFIRDDLVGGEYQQEGGPYSGPAAARFFSGLIDWLSEDSDLLELTNKKVAERILSYGKSLSLSPTEKEADEYSQGQQRTATRLRVLVIAGPVLLILLIWLLATLQRRARKEQFLASVGGR